jgi:hypothetical protein
MQGWTLQGQISIPPLPGSMRILMLLDDVRQTLKTVAV